MGIYRKAKTDEERQKIVAEQLPKPEEYAGRFLELAQKYPDSPAAFEALTWLVTRVQSGDDVNAAVQLLSEEFIEDKRLEIICQQLVYTPTLAAESLLRAALEKSPHRNVQAQAAYSLAKNLLRQVQFAGYMQSQPEMAKVINDRYGEELAERLGELDPKQLNAEAEELLEHVVASFGDVGGRGRSLTDRAKGDLFELRHLAIGKVAPEIEGEDIDGELFKLNDYRGQVVLLVTGAIIVLVVGSSAGILAVRSDDAAWQLRHINNDMIRAASYFSNHPWQVFPLLASDSAVGGRLCR